MEALEEHVLDHSVPQIYFLRCGEYTKIGKTRGPVRVRLATLKIGNPYPIELVKTIVFFGDLRSAERQLHKQFASKRSVGEWFKLSDEDIRCATL